MTCALAGMCGMVPVAFGASPDYGPRFFDEANTRDAPRATNASPSHAQDIEVAFTAQGAVNADTVPRAVSARMSRDPAMFSGLRLAQAKPAATATDVPKSDSSGMWSGDAFKLGGFYQGTFAYTYSDPVHWSRLVQRVQVTAEGNLGEHVKYKLGGRLDVDPLYYWSDFYLQGVKDNERLSAIWGENYIDFEAGGWDFRLGAQHIIWGEVVGLFFADVVSARDTRDFLLPSFDIIRIPQWAARAEYFKGDSHIEFIWIPVPTFDRIGKPGADFYLAPLPSPTPQAVASLFNDPQRPSRSLNNSSYGVRANTLLSGWDLAAFYYRSYSAQPTFYRYPSLIIGQPFEFQPQYDRIWQAGGTLSKDFNDFVLRAEAVYTGNQGFAVANLTTPQGVVKRNYLDYILSVEWPITDKTRLNVQGFQRAFFGGGESDLAIKSGGFGASVLLAHKLTPTVEPQILWIQNFQDAGGLIRPRVSWTPAKNASVAFGVDIFTGPSDGFFGRYNNRDRLYTELRYDF